MTMSIDAAVVRVRAADGRVVGAGFLVSQRNILTCAHVVAQALGLPEDASATPRLEVNLDFPLAWPERRLSAQVVCWHPALPDGSGDVAGLELVDAPPVGARPVRLVKAGDPWGHSFRAFGFPHGYPNGVWASGRILGREATGWLQVEDVRQTGYFIAPGFSGGPVWDEALDGVVGMTVAADTHQGVRSAFIIPTDRLLAAWPDLATQAIPPCPYRGLLAFREQDAPFFFGQETFTERLVQAVEQHALVVAVLGPSGSGKSSVVSAGLLPHLRQPEARYPQTEGWVITQFRPGSRPFDELAGALLPLLEPPMSETDRLVEVPKLAGALRAGELALHRVAERILRKSPEAGRLLLVIDQFEELYTLCPEAEARRRFLDVLLAALAEQAEQHQPTLTLVLVLRVDFLGQSMAYRPFADVLDQAQKLMLGPMTRDGLQAAIVRPAERQGVTFEDGLVGRILDDVGSEPGNLPLLEFALTQLWEHQESGCLTHAAYEDIGRVEGALTHYADQVYGGLNEVERRRARRVFVQLVRPGEGTEDTRRRATRAELGGANWALVRRLADARLVVTDRDPAGQEVAEVAHETLIRGWGRLRAWMSADRAFRVWQERLRGALRQWMDSDRDAGALLRGVPLAEAERWLAERSDDLRGEERAFVRTSATRAKRAKCLTVGAVALAFLVVSTSALIAWGQRNAFKEQRQIAYSQRLAAHSARELGADNYDVALLLAIEAGRTAETDESFAALNQALAHVQHPLLALSGHTGPVYQVAWSQDERRILTASDDGTARVWDTATGILLLTLFGHTDGVEQAIWNRDESHILTASDDGAARVWDAQTGAELLTLPGHTGPVRQALWSRDESRILTAGDDGTARVWDARTGAELLAFSGHTAGVRQAVWDGDGRRILTASDDGTARVWDAETGTDLLVLSGHTAGVRRAVWNGEGSRVLTASDDGTARVWNAATGEELLTLVGHTGSVYQAVWSGDESRVLTASWDGTARVWNAETGTELLILSGHTDGIRQAVWNREESRILTAGADGAVRVWNARTGKEELALFSHTLSVYQAAWNGDESCILAGAWDGTARVWDAATGVERLALSGHLARVSQAVWNRDESRILTAGGDGTARVWDAETGEQLVFLFGHAGPVCQATWSKDERRILTASWDGTARVWDASTGRELVTLSGQMDRVWQAVWNGDESRILTASLDGVARVWDATTGRELLALPGHTAAVYQVMWNRDESRILTASWDGTARVWDAATGSTLLTLSGHAGSVYQAVWNRDESRILTASGDDTVRIWNAETGVELRTLSDHTDGVRQAVWSRDESHILTASWDGTARVWDVRTGAELLVLSGHTGPVYQAVWNRDESRILTAGGDGTARVWDAERGIVLLTLSGHTATVCQSVWSADESRILTASDDGTVRLYYTQMDDLLEVACRCVPRNMTSKEWWQFMPGEPYRPTCSGLPAPEG